MNQRRHYEIREYQTEEDLREEGGCIKCFDSLDEATEEFNRPLGRFTLERRLVCVQEKVFGQRRRQEPEASR